MFRQTNKPGLFPDPIQAVAQEEDPEIELAFRLQNSSAGDERILEALVTGYAAEIYRLVRAIVEEGSGVLPASEIEAIVRQTFISATCSPESFWGETSVRTWLYGIALDLAAKRLASSESMWGPGNSEDFHPDNSSKTWASPSHNHESQYSAIVKALPEEQRLTFLLRFVFGVSGPDLDHILEMRRDRLTALLASASFALLAGHGEAKVPKGAHVKICRKIEAGLAGYGDELSAREEVQEHLEHCAGCQSFYERRQELEGELAVALQECWPLPEFSQEELQRMMEAARRAMGKQAGAKRASFPLKKAGWLGGVLLTCLALFWIFNQVDLQAIEPPSRPSITATPLPPPLQFEPALQTSRLEAQGPAAASLVFGSQVRLEQSDSMVTSLAFSADGRLLVAGSSDGSVRLWNSLDGGRISELKRILKGAITRVALSPGGGEWVAAGSFSGHVAAWRSTDTSRFYMLDRQPGRVISLDFSADGSKLVVGTSQSAWIWQIQDKAFIRKVAVEYAPNGINDLAYSPIGDLLAVASNDGTVWLQDILSKEVNVRLGGHASTPTSVAFSADGGSLAVGWKNGIIDLWGINRWSGQNIEAVYLKSIQRSGKVNELAFSQDGQNLASSSLAGSELQVWEVSTGERLEPPESQSLNHPWFNGVFAYLGKYLAAASIGREVYVWGEIPLVETPRYFVRSDSDETSWVPAKLNQPGEGSFEYLSSLAPPGDNAISIYRAADSAGFEAHAPAMLPLRFAFLGAFVQEGRTIGAYYRHASPPGSQQGIDLYILQTRLPDVLERPQVGNSAMIHQASVNNRYAEYLQGDWLYSRGASREAMDSEPTVRRMWDTNAPYQRLIWRGADRLYEIQARSAPGNLILTKDTLVALAESLQPLARLAIPADLTVAYTIQEGDTCYGIALHYGTTTGELARRNDLSDCDLIWAGSELSVPLPTARQTLDEVDLDCDGISERVQVIPVPARASESLFFGIVLETLDEGGLYQEHWWYTVADEGAAYLARAEVIPGPACQQFLAVEPVGGRNPGRKLFRWDGERVVPVEDAQAGGGYVARTDLVGEERARVSYQFIFIDRNAFR